MATTDKLIERYLGILIGVVVAILVFLLNPSFNKSAGLVRALPQLTTCIFGFLLTLLGIILQSESPVIVKMRGKTEMYNRFIDFNKRIVVLSFVISFFSLLVGYIDFSWVHDFCDSIWVELYPTTGRIVLAVLSFGMVWLIVDMITFVKLFYKLIKQSK